MQFYTSHPGQLCESNVCSIPWGWSALNDATAALQSAYRHAGTGKPRSSAYRKFRDVLPATIAEQPINRIVDGLMITDAQRNALFLNIAFVKLFAIDSQLQLPYTAGHFYGLAESFIVAGAKNNPVAPLRAPRPLRFTVSRSDYVQFNAEVWSTSVRSDAGRVIAYIDIVRDLTVLDWISNSNSAHETMLKYQISRWCAAAGHDLKSSLAEIQVYRRAVKHSFCNAEVQTLLREIDAACIVFASIGELLTGSASGLFQEI